MSTGRQIVARLEIRDLADETDEFFQFGHGLRDGIAAALERILLRRFGRSRNRPDLDVAKRRAGHPGRQAKRLGKFNIARAQ